MHNTVPEMELPYLPETEKAILGSILLNPDLFLIAAENLTTTDFYIKPHRLVFSAMSRLLAKNDQIDAVNIGAELGDDLNQVGGIAVIVNWSFGLSGVSLTRSETFRGYCTQVKDRSRLRALITKCGEISSMAMASPSEADEILQFAQQAMHDICISNEKKGLRHLSEITEKVVNDAIDLHNSLGKDEKLMSGLPTGLQVMDRMTNGFQPSDLVIIAGRPGMGKSALAGQIALNACRQNPETMVLIFSLELSEEQYTQRFLANAAQLSTDKIRHGTMHVGEVPKLKTTADELNKLGIFIDDSSSVNAAMMRSKILEHKHKYGRVDAVIVDFIQRMTTARKTDSRQQEVSRIAQELKSLAKDFALPIIALSSLNRGSEGQMTRRPRMSDLRDSGDIESEADMVAFVHRQSYYDKSSDPKEVEFIIDKHRHGATGTVYINYDGEFYEFTDRQQTYDSPKQYFQRTGG